MRDSFKNAISILEKDGAKIEEINLPHIEYSLPAYYVIAPAECSANLADMMELDLAIEAERIFFRGSLCKFKNRRIWQRSKNRIFIGTFCLSAVTMTPFTTRL